jgi:hypothetical protein
MRGVSSTCFYLTQSAIITSSSDRRFLHGIGRTRVHGGIFVSGVFSCGAERIMGRRAKGSLYN